MARTNFVDANIDHKRVLQIVNDNSEHEHMSVLDGDVLKAVEVSVLDGDILKAVEASVLDGDVLKAAQKVVIVQAVQVLAHLSLAKKTKTMSIKGFAWKLKFFGVTCIPLRPEEL